MRKFLTLTFLILLGFSSFAKEIEQYALVKVYHIDVGNGIGVVKFPIGLDPKRTSKFTIVPLDGRACETSLLRRKKRFALFDLSKCFWKGTIKVGQNVKLISIRDTELEKSVLNTLEEKEERDRVFEREELWLNMVKKEAVAKSNNEFGAQLAASTFSTGSITQKDYRKYNLEDWYFSVSASRLSSSYSGEVQNDLNDIDTTYGLSDSSFAFDSGFYKPTNDGRTLWGASFFYLLNMYSGGETSTNASTTVNSVSNNISQIFIGPSYMKFMGTKRTGEGLFFRGDLGLSFYSGIETKDLIVSNLNQVEESTYSFSPGIGYLLGIGYAYEWDKKKSVLFELNYLKTSATLTSKSTTTNISGVESTVEEDINESVSSTNILLKVGLFF